MVMEESQKAGKCVCVWGEGGGVQGPSVAPGWGQEAKPPEAESFF